MGTGSRWDYRPALMRSSVLAALTIVLVHLPGVARAESCQVDDDCNDNGVCAAGRCTPALPEVSENDLSAPSPLGPDAGWTLPAGVMGMASAAAVLGLGIGAATSLDNVETTDDVLGASALGLLAVMTPVTMIGAHSGEARGSIGLEVASWVTYGLGLTSGLLALAVEDVTEDGVEELVLTATGFATASLLAMGASGFIAHGRSRAAHAQARLGSVLDATGRRQPTLGLVVLF